ncbi:MAG: TolC family protein, partial [Paracoccaceae bacterium]|nr:TolC family protein [Paracoccaceae bacterium]
VLDNHDWWRQFKDPVLDGLVERALSESLSLELAKERVIEAQAARDGLPMAANLAPNARVQRERQDGGPDLTRSEASLGFDWLLDIYGARRAQIEAAGARIEIADAELDAARLLLLLNLANAYVDLRYQQASLHLRRSELRSRRQTLDLVETLFKGDAATSIDVVRAKALVSETQAEIPALEAAIANLKSEIAVLSGRMPGQALPDLDSRAAQPRVSLSPKVGI